MSAASTPIVRQVEDDGEVKWEVIEDPDGSYISTVYDTQEEAHAKLGDIQAVATQPLPDPNTEPQTAETPEQGEPSGT